jgi:hypothetical protein
MQRQVRSAAGRGRVGRNGGWWLTIFWNTTAPGAQPWRSSTARLYFNYAATVSRPETGRDTKSPPSPGSEAGCSRTNAIYPMKLPVSYQNLYMTENLTLVGTPGTCTSSLREA